MGESAGSLDEKGTMVGGCAKMGEKELGGGVLCTAAVLNVTNRYK